MQFDKTQGAAVAGSGGWRWPVVGGYRSFCAIAGKETLRIRHSESRWITAACVCHNYPLIILLIVGQVQQQGFVDKSTDEDDAWVQQLCVELNC